jgi:uncharacterized membrane protein YuzA (DUF378 family)
MAHPDVSTTSTNTSARPTTSASTFNALDWIATLLLIIGGLNWGLVGAFDVDIVAALFGSGSTISRVVYILVGLSALYGLYMMTKMGRSSRTG